MVVATDPFCDLVHVRPGKALVLGGGSLHPNSEALQAGEALSLAFCLHVLHACQGHRLIRRLLSAQQMGGWCFSMGQTESKNRLKILLTAGALRRSR